jgi:hypothetical protein
MLSLNLMRMPLFCHKLVNSSYFFAFHWAVVNIQGIPTKRIFTQQLMRAISRVLLQGLKTEATKIISYLAVPVPQNSKTKEET